MNRLLAVENLKIYARPSTRAMLISLWFAALLAAAGEHYLAPTGAAFWASMAGQSWAAILVRIFAVIVAGGAVANEYAWGTIKLLLIRPVSRGRILMAKYLAVLLFAAAMMAILLLALILVNGIISATGRLPAETAKAGTVQTPGGVLALFGLRYVEIIAYATIAFMLSAVSRSNALAIGVTFFAMALGPEAAGFLEGSGLGRYFLFSQTGLIRFLEPQEGLGFALMVIGAHLAAFYAAAWWAFVKRDVMERR